MVEKIIISLIEAYPKIVYASWAILAFSVLAICAVVVIIVVRKKEFSVFGPVVVSAVSAFGILVFCFNKKFLPGILSTRSFDWVDGVVLFGIFMGSFILHVLPHL